MNASIIKSCLRRGRQFSLRTAFLAVTVLAIWLGRHANQYRSQKALVAAVVRGGGYVRYRSDEYVSGFGPLRERASRLVGRDHCDSISAVVLRLPPQRFFWTPKKNHMRKAPLPLLHAPARLEQMDELGYLDVSNTDFDDQYLARLSHLEKLAVVDLRFTNVSDEGLACIKDYPALTTLRLAGDRITDAGLRRLRRIKTLKDLYLTETRVTNAELAAFRLVTPSCEVYLDEY